MNNALPQYLFRSLIGVATLLLLSGCGTQNSSTSTTLHVQKNSGDGHVATAVLLHAPLGTADLSWDTQRQTLSVTMQMIGLAPGSLHPTHIHLGVCDAPGAMLYALPQLVANDLGQASMKAVVKQVTHLPTHGWLLNVHNGPTMDPSQGQNLAIACGTLTMKGGDRLGPLHEHIVLQGTTASNESARGTAQLSLDAAGTLTVTVIVHGLEANSKHAVHIHAGSCEKQGKMLYPLAPLLADANGDASETASFPHVTALPASNWYVNIHFAEAITNQQGQVIQQAFNPIACGNVIVS